MRLEMPPPDAPRQYRQRHCRCAQSICSLDRQPEPDHRPFHCAPLRRDTFAQQARPLCTDDMVLNPATLLPGANSIPRNGGDLFISACGQLESLPYVITSPSDTQAQSPAVHTQLQATWGSSSHEGTHTLPTRRAPPMASAGRRLQAAVCRRNTSRRPAQSCDNQDAGLLSGSRPKAAADDNARVRADPAPSGHDWGARRH